MGGDYMKNAMVSMLIAMVANSVLTYMMGTEPHLPCSPGVNDFNWNTSYRSPGIYNPTSMVKESTFIVMDDGTKLAADYYISSHVMERGDKVPTVLHLTRYGRAYTLDFPFSLLAKYGDMINPRTGGIIPRLVTHGYAWVVVDVRGTGASYGRKDVDFSQQEAKDSSSILDWIVEQPWSNGKVASYAMGFEGVGTFLMASQKHEALKAIVVNGVPTDIYNDVMFPGGLLNVPALDLFNSFTGSLDRQIRWNRIPSLKARLMMKIFGGNVYPVNEDKEALAEAVNEHWTNPNLTEEIFDTVKFRDDKLKNIDMTFDEFDISSKLKDIAESGVAVYAFGGYFDTGSARGAIKLFEAMSSTENAGQSRLTLGPWCHAGTHNSDPHADSKQMCFEHMDEACRFFDFHMFDYRRPYTGLEDEDPIHYFTMVQNVWHSSSVWPPAYIEQREFLFNSNNSMAMAIDEASDVNGQVSLDVDPQSSIHSKATRWNIMHHIFVSPPQYYGNRQEIPRVLSFESEKLPQMEITGDAELRVFFSVDAPDVALIAYLEDVDYTLAGHGEKQRRGVTYITEGQLRPIHQANPAGSAERSFTRDDAKPLEVGVVHEAVFKFLPVSYFLKRGHRLRVSISVAEANDFHISTQDLASKLTIHYGPDYPTSLKLPMRDVTFKKISEEELPVVVDDAVDSKDEL